MHSPLTATETEIIGQWSSTNGTVCEDANAKRIHWLLARHLTYLGTDESGWQKLYVNPKDGQCWELSYPQSDLTGGGPPALTRMAQDAAQQLYRVQR